MNSQCVISQTTFIEVMCSGNYVSQFKSISSDLVAINVTDTE